MARSRPCGRSKSDHRDCQAVRFARAAEYRERISISAERQQILIAAVNAQSDDAPAPCRRRCQRSKGLKPEGQPARKFPQGQCFSAANQKAKRQNARLLKEALDWAAERGEQSAVRLLLQMQLLKLRIFVHCPASSCIEDHSVSLLINSRTSAHQTYHCFRKRVVQIEQRINHLS
jgi:hypothetical protein